MTSRRPREEKGQIFPILLLVVVVLAAFGFAIAQLGSAGDQKTQTQSAADAGALAAARALAANLLLAQPPLLFDILGSYALPATSAESAAQRSWSLNDHQGRQLASSDVATDRVDIGTMRVTVTAPAGVIIDGPVRGAVDTRPVAAASATITLSCQGLGGTLNVALNVLHRLLGLSGAACPVAPPPTTTTAPPGPTTTLSGPPVVPPPVTPVTVDLTDILRLVDTVLVS